MKKLTKFFAFLLNAITFGYMSRKAKRNNTLRIENTNAKTSFKHTDLIDHFGGIDNITDVSATLSKVKIKFKDKSKVDFDKITKYPEVTGSIESTQSVDLIIGQAAKTVEIQIKEMKEHA